MHEALNLCKFSSIKPWTYGISYNICYDKSFMTKQVSFLISVCVLSCSVMSYSLQPYGLYPPRLLCPMDCIPPGSSVHGMFQARILEWVAVPFTRGDLPNPEIKSTSPVSSALQADSLLLSHQGRPHEAITHCHQFSPPPSPWQPPFYFLSI